MRDEFDELDGDWADEPAAGPLTRLRDAGRNLLGPPAEVDEDAPPTRMQPPEDRVGYAVAVVLVIAGVLFATVHGKGSPKHPNPLLPILGVVAAVALPVAIVRFRNRFISAILGVISALLISFSKPPNSLIGIFYFTVIVGIGWMFWLTRKQSKAAKAQLKNQPRRSTDQRGAPRQRRRRGEKTPQPTGPTANRRYTPPQPPKPKRARGAPLETAGRKKGEADVGRTARKAVGRTGAGKAEAADADEAPPARRVLRRRG